MRAIRRSNSGCQWHDGAPIHDACAIANLSGELSQLCITAFSASPVHTHKRQGGWIVGQRQEILLDRRGVSFRGRSPRSARWRGLISSRLCGGDDDAQDSKSSRPGEKAGMDRSDSLPKTSETARNRTGRKPKPLKPGLY
jgi:hypothetical protein